MLAGAAVANMLLAKRTKMPILCSEGAKTREISPFLTQKCRFCAQNARKWGFRRPKKHKNPDFVLKKPENEGSRPQKRTKMPILCSKCPKTRVAKPKSAQKCRFCAREERELASGSITAETLIVNVAFEQITAHTYKIQIPYNQIMNFQSRAR